MNRNKDLHNDTATHGALLGTLRESGWTMRSIASVIILTFGGLVTSPAMAAVKQEVQKIQWHKQDDTAAAKLSAKVEEAHGFLKKLAAQDPKGVDIKAAHAQVHSLMSDLASLDKGAMDNFAAVEEHIKTHNLPAEIEKRQQDAVKTYRTRMDTLVAELKAADEAKDAPTFLAHVNKAKAHLDQVQAKPFHEKFDPKNLPFSVAKPTTQKPRLTKKDYQAHPVAPLKRVNVASNGSLMGIVTAATLGASVPTSPSDPSYVAATDDVQITPAIQAEAAALHNDPVQIYNWVHNNVEYIPTYGSIQGSDMTLQTLKGNDFDQASLLIALLRASNIPARYVYGTIQVPIAQVENWVGGVTDPNAALNLLGQGGIPTNAVVQGGQIAYGQLEHVWVEAWVNFIPSHAAKPGPGNAWVPMDASFKQYAFGPAANVEQLVSFDTGAVAKHIESTTVTNGKAGSISSIDEGFLQQQAFAFENNSVNYFQGAGATLTSRQLLGFKDISQHSLVSLPAALSYQVIATANRFVSLPSALVTQFQYTLSDANGDQIFQYLATTPDLEDKAVALSFDPATANDKAALDSFLANGQAGTDPIALPSSLPGYLINLVPQMTVDGQVVAVGTPFQMGTDLQSDKGYWTPKDGWVLSSKPITVGQYQIVGLDLQDITDGVLTNLQASFQNTALVLSSGGIPNKHQIVGSFLQYGAFGYLGINDAQNILAGRRLGVVTYRAPSFGTFSSVVTPVSNFGVVSQVKFDGLLMDMDGIHNIVVANDGNQAEMVQFNEIAGMRLSAFENLVPESLMQNLDPTGSGVSAVKALQTSLLNGQPIYVATAANIATVSQELSVPSDVSTSIADAINAGDVVVTEGKPNLVGNWNGVGFILLDPTTGDGAYLLAGGANGGAYKPDNNSFDINNYESVGADVVGEYGTSPFQKFFGKAIEGLGNILGVYKISQNCSGPAQYVAGVTYATGIAASTSFVSETTAGMAVVWETLGLAATIAPLLTFLIAAIIAVLLLDLLLSIIIDVCTGRSLPIPANPNY